MCMDRIIELEYRHSHTYPLSTQFFFFLFLLLVKLQAHNITCVNSFPGTSGLKTEKSYQAHCIPITLFTNMVLVQLRMCPLFYIGTFRPLI